MLSLPVPKKCVCVVVVAEPVLQPLTQPSLHTEEPGAVVRATCDSRPWRQGEGALGRHGFHDDGHGDGAGMASAVLPAWAPPACRALGVWPLSSVGFGPWKRLLAVLVFSLLARRW